MAESKDFNNVVFQLEADAQIGVGHLMRCMVIADELKKEEKVCYFLSRELAVPLRKLVVQKGHKVCTIDSEQSALKQLESLRPEWTIVDNYELDATFERRVCDVSRRLLVIDDLANRTHYCDFLLDQSPLRTKADYQSRVNENCQFLLGANYVLIRPEFRTFRKSSITSWEKALISLGGADPDNITLVILKALESVPQMKSIKWSVIAGVANLHWKALDHYVARSQLDITLIKESSNIASLLADNDFAIGAAGGMAWERSCIGIPTLTIPIADNQRSGLEVIRHFRLGETLEIEELNSTHLSIALGRLRRHADDYLVRNQMLVDGFGVRRLLKAVW